MSTGYVEEILQLAIQKNIPTTPRQAARLSGLLSKRVLTAMETARQDVIETGVDQF